MPLSLLPGEARVTRSHLRLFQFRINITLKIQGQIIETHGEGKFQVMDKLNAGMPSAGHTFKQVTAMAPVRG